MNNFQDKVSFIWDLADLLRNVYKKNEYQKVILPFTILKRFDCVLGDTKKKVVDTFNQYKKEIDNMEHLLLNSAKHDFYNYSKYDFQSLLDDPEHIEQNLLHYIDCFSKNVQDIFGDNGFNIKPHVAKLAKHGILFLLIKKFSESRINLHPDIVSNHEMGTIFEELVRKFSEQSNEEAGDHFTPREVVELMTHLMFEVSEVNVEEKDVIKTVYDPACGTGGMLTSAKNYIYSKNPSMDVVLFGQELLEEIYAICKADMLMKGENSDNIQGPYSSLSNDKFPDEKFDFIISNPPYGKKWELDEEVVKAEAEKGFDGRFGSGTPRIGDGQLLFLQHMISKMKINGEKSRIAAITNGSPLFTGDAGGGESDTRKWMIENDYIEAIIALPNQLFYNTSINTYVWILTNKKPADRVGKVQLIDATSFFNKMRKSLGDKRNELSDNHIGKIVDLYNNFKGGGLCKVLDSEEFGYTKVIVERPLQLNYQVSEERLENLYGISTFVKFAESKKTNPEEKLEEETKGKEKQEEIISALKSIGDKLYKKWGEFEPLVEKTLKKFKFKPVFIKSVILALSEHDDTAEYVLDKKGNRQPDSNLRDSEKIPLKQDIEEYFKREVLTYYSDAWMDRKKDKIGYELNLTPYFYKYVPPRALEDIEKDIEKVTAEIQGLIKEDIK